MTLFDVIAGLILLVSVLVGFARGALREVTTVVALVVAAFVAIFGLRITGPLARAAIHPSWAATVAALLIVFLAVYVLVRVFGGSLTRGVHSISALGGVDRGVGTAIGLVRGLLALGVLMLAFNMVTPREREPAWITTAALYPLSQGAANVLRSLAPRGSALAQRLKPAIEHAVETGASDQPAEPPSSARSGQSGEIGYSGAARQGLDDVVEKSR